MEDRHLHMAYGTGGRVDKHEQKEKGKQTETKKSPEKRELRLTRIDVKKRI